MADAQLFPGFAVRRIRTAGADIHCVVGGHGPPLLMLHGFPQTHAMWHRIAPMLAQRFTVVCPDLRGYGDSSRPPTTPDHAPYSKRALAADMVEVMQALGHPRFALVGHDRGARVAHRLARDHAGHVTQLALLDICPTASMYAATDFEFAKAYYHWFFLIQPFDLPERLIGADPRYYVHRLLAGWGNAGLDVFDPIALREYERCFEAPGAIHAMCEDYRAAASIDLAHDRDDGARIACPLLVLWGAHGVVARLFDPLAEWSAVANDVRGEAFPAGHYLAEEVPDATFAALAAFLATR
ncbi:MAG: alpha/beta hydrolase [Proteobacteria bacterium]|nr:alpha/beta hydrolase [Pseudomonadota bacterium]